MDFLKNGRYIYINIIDVLIRLDNESKEQNITKEEYFKRGQAIKFLMNKIEEDFGELFLKEIFIQTNEKLGRTLSLLDISIVQKLLLLGFEIKEIKKGFFSHTKK